MFTETTSNNNFSQEGTSMGIDGIVVGGKDYATEFWNKEMRGKTGNYDKLKGGMTSGEAFVLSCDSNRKYKAALELESLFRQYATNATVSASNNTVWVTSSEDMAVCVPEGETIVISDIDDDYSNTQSKAHKLVSLVKVTNDLVADNAFDIKDHLVKRSAKSFGRAEDNLFINGTGDRQPVGILGDVVGAETGVTVTEVTYDDVINLYVSVKER